MVRDVADRVPIALATVGPAPADRRRPRPHDLVADFTATVSSAEVPRGKPSPDVYLEAARRLGAPPTDCVGVEDSSNGIRAVHAAGMTVVAFPNPTYPPKPDALALADQVAADLDGRTKQAARAHRGADRRRGSAMTLLGTAETFKADWIDGLVVGVRPHRAPGAGRLRRGRPARAAPRQGGRDHRRRMRALPGVRRAGRRRPRRRGRHRRRLHQPQRRAGLPHRACRRRRRRRAVQFRQLRRRHHAFRSRRTTARRRGDRQPHRAGHRRRRHRLGRAHR